MLGVQVPPGLPLPSGLEHKTQRRTEMSKIAESMGAFRGFFGEVSAELKKCAWPTKPELFDSTVVVIISVALLGGFVAVCDLVLRELIRLVMI